MNLEKADRVLPDFSLGWELEAIHRASRHIPGVACGHDGSVGGQSLEYKIKKEVVYDSQKSLAALRLLATDPTLEVDRSCGFHVHIGLGRRSRHLKTWAKWYVQLARDIEQDAFEAVPASRRENHFCRSWKEHPDSLEDHTYPPSKYNNSLRYNWVNAVEVFRPTGIRTIEVRLLGDTCRYSYLLAWVSACRLMGASSWALMFDPSRFELERTRMKEVMKNIGRYFLHSGPRREAVRYALTLATRARLSIPFGNSLSEVALQEKKILGVRSSSDQDRFYYEMREAYLNQTRAASPMIAGIRIGDSVECVSQTIDGGVEVGGIYRVYALSPGAVQSVQVLLSGGSTWYVDPRCLRRVESVRV